MICPECDREMGEKRYGFDEAVRVPACAQCGGQLFGPGQLDAVDDSTWTNVEAAAYAPAPGDPLRCPRGCSGEARAAYREAGRTLAPLQSLDLPALMLHRCAVCASLWLRAEMVEHARALASRIDARLVGDFRLQAKLPTKR